MTRCSGTPSCASPAGVSGTFLVTATVNGLVKTKSARVEVKTDQLNASANKSTVKPGEEVTFTASTQNGTNFSVQSWVWTGTGGGSSAMTPSGSSCGQSKTCKIRVYEPGYMTVTGVVEGTTIPQQVSVQITVVPCPPLDPGAASPSPLEVDVIRQRLLEELALSRSGTYSERGGEIWYNPTTSEYYVRVIPNLKYPNSCQYQKDMANAPPVPAGFTVKLAVIWHTHPDMINKQPSSNCPKGGPGKLTGPGPSPGDWWAATSESLEGIMIDANLDLWQHNVPPDQYYNAFDLETTTKWKKDGDSICYVDKKRPFKAPL